MSRPVSQYKQIKNIVERLPFGVGASLVVPIVRWFLDILAWRKLMLKFRQNKDAKQEARRIEAEISRGAKRIVFVYDESCSPPTFGDYLVVILLARYFRVRGLEIEFYIVSSEFRKDWGVLNADEIVTLINEKSMLALNLINPKSQKIRCLSWAELEKISLSWDETTVVPFSGNVKNRLSIYNRAFNLANYFLSKATPEQLDKVLFSYGSIKHLVSLDMPDFPYITWHVRYSEKWELRRNTTNSEFETIYRALTQKFPKHVIVVVSDALGCEYFRKLSNELGIKVHFSKEYSSSFLGDAALVLNSKYYFQLRGGGIGIFPIFSLMPYTRVASMSNEVKWSFKRATSWQTKSQIFWDYDADFNEAMIPCLNSMERS